MKTYPTIKKIGKGGNQMPKINKEEYEVLKALDSRAKSIVRQARGWLWVAEQPIMKDEIGWYVEDGFDAVLEDDSLFHFIQWEDREPYNIAELIKEYEYSNEPEVLSQEWISDHIIFNEKEDAEYVYADKLQNLLVPKQEEVDRAYKDGYEKGKEYTFYKGYLEGLADKEKEPETVASVIADFYKSFERFKEVISMEVEELEE